MKIPPVRRLAALMNGALDPGEGEGGMADGSEAHRACQEFGLPVHPHEPGNPQGDLFKQGPAEFDIDDSVWEQFPLKIGGPEPADAIQGPDAAEQLMAWAWDEEEVMVACPRGWCTLPRKEWEEGFRTCRGC